METWNYQTWVSEWAAIKSYGRIGVENVNHQFLRCVPYPLNHTPAWGNLIFVTKEKSSQFSQVLATYIQDQERIAVSKTRRQSIEALPLVKLFYRLLKNLRNILIKK